jgi:hypothetical protein
MTSIKMMIMLRRCQHQVFCIFVSGIAGLMPGFAIFVQVSQDPNLIKDFYYEQKVLRILFATTRLLLSEAKSKVPDWGIKLTLA